MKKVLFASTALVLSAGVASAQGIELTGGGNFGLKQGVGPNDDIILHYELDFNIVASGTTDNGLTFGASADLDPNPSMVNDPELFISGAFGTLTVGALDPATDGLGLPDLGFDGIGMDDDVEALRNVGGANAIYEYDVSGFSILLALGLDENGNPAVDGIAGDYGILLGYDFDGFSVEAGYSRDDSAGMEAYGIEASYSFDGITVTGLYIDGDMGSGYGLNAAYSFDAFTVSASYSDDDNTDADYGIGGEYDLGGGLALAGAVGSRNGDTVFDLGVTMDF